MRPRPGIAVELHGARVSIEIRVQICKVHVAVATGQQRSAYRLEHAGLVAAEMIAEDEIERGTGVRLVIIVPVRVVPAASVVDLLRRAVDGLDGTDEAKIGLLYWLGRASEALGKRAEAMASYERAVAVDIRFMDLSERMHRLTAGRRS